jgi:hypothetical protein
MLEYEPFLTVFIEAPKRRGSILRKGEIVETVL